MKTQIVSCWRALSQERTPVGMQGKLCKCYSYLSAIDPWKYHSVTKHTMLLRERPYQWTRQHPPPLCFLSTHFASQTAPVFTAISERNKIPKLLEVKTNSWKKSLFSLACLKLNVLSWYLYSVAPLLIFICWFAFQPECCYFAIQINSVVLLEKWFNHSPLSLHKGVCN